MALEAFSEDQEKLLDQEVAAARQELDEAVRAAVQNVGRKISEVEERFRPERVLQKHPLAAGCAAVAIGFLYGTERSIKWLETLAIGIALGYAASAMRRDGLNGNSIRHHRV